MTSLASPSGGQGPAWGGLVMDMTLTVQPWKAPESCRLRRGPASNDLKLLGQGTAADENDGTVRHGLDTRTPGPGKSGGQDLESLR